MRKLLLAFLLILPTIVFAQQGATSRVRRGSSLPTTCGGGDVFIKSGASSGFYFNIASGTCSWVGPTVMSASDVVGLFSSCSGTQYLGADGACHSGSGTLTGSGASGLVPVWGGTTSLTSDSQFAYDTTTHVLTVGDTSSPSQGFVTLKDSAGTHSATIKAPTSISSNYIWLLPTADSSGCIQSNGSGTLSITTCGSSGLADPGGNGIVKRTALNTTAVVSSTDVVGLFTSCSGTQYLGADGACHTASGGSGSLVFLGSATASSSTELDFTSLITSTYDDYVVFIDDLIPNTSTADTRLQFSANNGSSYDTANTNYSWSGNYALASGSSGGAVGYTNSLPGLRVGVEQYNTVSGNAISSRFEIHNPLGTTVWKRIIGQYTSRDARDSVTSLMNFQGTYLSTAAQNAFRIVPSSGNFTSGVVRLYGVAH